MPVAAVDRDATHGTNVTLLTYRWIAGCRDACVDNVRLRLCLTLDGRRASRRKTALTGPINELKLALASAIRWQCRGSWEEARSSTVHHVLGADNHRRKVGRTLDFR